MTRTRMCIILHRSRERKQPLTSPVSQFIRTKKVKFQFILIDSEDYISG